MMDTTPTQNYENLPRRPAAWNGMLIRLDIVGCARQGAAGLSELPCQLIPMEAEAEAGPPMPARIRAARRESSR